MVRNETKAAFRIQRGKSYKVGQKRVQIRVHLIPLLERTMHDYVITVYVTVFLFF